MKTGSFPWKAREGQTFDPKLVNENFRKGADYVRDALKLKYTYSTITFDLAGIDTNSVEWKRRFAFFPPNCMDVVGAELVCNNLDEEDNVFVEWVVADPADGIRLITNDVDTATVQVPCVHPKGAPTETFRYLELNHVPGFPYSEDANLMQVRCGDFVSIGVHCLRIGSDTPTGVIFEGPLNPNKTGRLTIWLKSARGSVPVTQPNGISSEFSMPDLFMGRYTANADIFTDAANEINTQRGIAVASGNLNTYRCESYVVRDIEAVSNLYNITANQSITARIPSPTANLPSDPLFVLDRIDCGFVAADEINGFQNALTGRQFAVGVNDSGGATIDPLLPQITNLGGAGGPYFEIFRTGNPIDDPELSDAANTAADSADDNILFATDNGDTGTGAGDIEMVYVYLWYRLTQQ